MKSTSCIKKDVKPADRYAKKSPDKKPLTMEIHESLERIRDGKLSEMGLFELSIRGNMSCEVLNELRKRARLIKMSLADGDLARLASTLSHNLRGMRRRCRKGGRHMRS